MTARAHRIAPRIAPRGAPLVMLAALLTAWTGARALWWENPFPPVRDALAPVLGPVIGPIAQGVSDRVTDALTDPLRGPAIARVQLQALPQIRFRGVDPGLGGTGMAMAFPASDPRGFGRAAPSTPQLAAAHALLLRASARGPAVFGAGLRDDASALGDRTSAPFLPAADPARRKSRRWSVDGWAFWRQGSDSTPISQGRVPIYGASQIGAVFQYRLAQEGSRRDPRLFARAYRSLVRRGESEVSLGASLRPFPRLPLRAAAEVRYTDAAFTNEVRPAAFAVTELPPVALPLGAQFEAYGQAGWVGGASRTAFADGQASLTREIGGVARATNDRMRLSLGAAGWGGAQRDAERVDVGPTMRLDLSVGDVPARLSVDWRERVAGNAGPESGIAATLSTHF